MRNKTRNLFMFLALTLVPFFAYPVGPPCNGFADTVEKLIPAVVNISTEQKLQVSSRKGPGQFPNGNLFEEFRDFFEKFEPFFEMPDQEKEVVSLGSGFLIDSKGIIVTNYHVISNADEINVTLHNNEQYKAKIVGFDQRSDLAVLKINVRKELPYVELGNSEKARQGDWVIAIGNPFGFGGSVSVGVVSARGRDINLGIGSGDFIQTDAAINRGNSGGPLFDKDGKVVGINTAIYSPSGGNIGIGFAVPTNVFRPILETLAKGQKVTRGWLGVKIQEITSDIAESLGQKQSSGALVVEIIDNGPAAKAGLKIGDVIVEYNGKKIEHVKQLTRMVAQTAVDSRVGIKVMRKSGKKFDYINLKIKIEKLDEEEKSQSKSKDSQYEFMGVTVANLDEELRRKLNVKTDASAVVVVNSKNRNLRKGDLIMRAGNSIVSNVKDFKDSVEKEVSYKRKSILLLINRSGRTLFIGIPIN